MIRMHVVTGFLCTTLFALPALATAGAWYCAGGDTPCLVAALGKAQTQPERAHSIVLGAGIFTLTVSDNTVGDEGGNGLPAIVGKVTIWGAGSALTVIERADTAPYFRLFMIEDSGDLTLAYLTTRGGAVEPDWNFRAGCIANHGAFHFHDGVIEHCAAWVGGGLGTDGSLARLTRMVVRNNAADFVAAGIASNGCLVIDNSWIEGNIAEAEAGLGFAPRCSITIRGSVFLENLALYNTAGGLGGVGDVTIASSLFLHNQSVVGAAINLDDGTLTVRNSGIVENYAYFNGGGVRIEKGAATIQGSVITGNVAALGVAGGIQDIGPGTITLQGSILAGNDAPQGPNCVGEITLRGFNIVGDRSGCTVTPE